MRQWFADGRVNGQTRVKAEDSTEWKPLSAFPEFAALVGSVATASPVPPAEEPAPADPHSAPAKVATFHQLPEAELLKSRLEAEGIESWIPEEYSAQVFSDVIGLESVSVYVAVEDYEEAKAIASEMDSSALAGPPPPAPQPVAGSKPEPQDARDLKACVSCGAAIPQDATECPKCGWTQPPSVSGTHQGGL